MLYLRITWMKLECLWTTSTTPKGMKKVYGPSSGNKCQITILACSNAVATVLPPMVIFKGECLNHEWTKGEIPNTIYGMSHQGWIDQSFLLNGLKSYSSKIFQKLDQCCYF